MEFVTTNDPMEQALENLEILREVNLVIAPLSPNKTMIDIGASAGGVDLDTARIIYESMINTYRLAPLDD